MRNRQLLNAITQLERSSPLFFKAEWRKLCESGSGYFAEWVEQYPAFDPTGRDPHAALRNFKLSLMRDL